MTNSVTVNGNTYNDGNTAPNNMGNGGFRNYLIPMLSDAVADLAAKVTSAGTQVTLATNQATAAAASAQTALNAPGTQATSTTSLTIGLGSQSLTIQTGKSLAVGMWLIIASTASPTNWMAGPITAYNSGTGALTVNVQAVAGSGTIASWTVSLTAPGGAGLGRNTFTDAQNNAPAVSLASAATVNIGAAAANDITITGTTTITAFDTIAASAFRRLTFSGALTLTHNAASLILPGAANITTAAGDVAEFVSLGSGNWRCAGYNKANGQAVSSSSSMVLLATITPTASAAANALNVFTSAYDAYLIIGQGIAPSANDALLVQFANAGSLDTATNYYKTSPFSDAAASSATNSCRISDITVGTSGRGINFILTVQNVNDATNIKTMKVECQQENTTANNFVSSWQGTAYIGANTVTGLGFFWNLAANFKAQGKIYIYGIKNT